MLQNPEDISQIQIKIKIDSYEGKKNHSFSFQDPKEQNAVAERP